MGYFERNEGEHKELDTLRKILIPFLGVKWLIGGVPASWNPRERANVRREVSAF